MNAGTVVVSGIVMLIGLWWQFHLFTEHDCYHSFDDPPLRMRVPIVVGIVAVLGVLFGSIFCWYDVRKPDFGGLRFLIMNAKALVFAGAINVKSYFGPAVSSYCLSYEAYSYIEYGEFKTLPILSSLASWLCEFGPEWLSALYLVATAGYCLVSAGLETFLERW